MTRYLLIRKEAILMEQFVPLISEVGFPTVVTLYLLYRIESKLDLVVQSIQNLPERLKERTWGTKLDLKRIFQLEKHLTLPFRRVFAFWMGGFCDFEGVAGLLSTRPLVSPIYMLSPLRHSPLPKHSPLNPCIFILIWL
jgi:hypothetical protein